MSLHDTIPVLLNYGGAKKSSFEMSPHEFKKASGAIKKEQKRKLFLKAFLCTLFEKEG